MAATIALPPALNSSPPTEAAAAPPSEPIAPRGAAAAARARARGGGRTAAALAAAATPPPQPPSPPLRPQRLRRLPARMTTERGQGRAGARGERRSVWRQAVAVVRRAGYALGCGAVASKRGRAASASTEASVAGGARHRPGQGRHQGVPVRPCGRRAQPNRGAVEGAERTGRGEEAAAGGAPGPPPKKTESNDELDTKRGRWRGAGVTRVFRRVFVLRERLCARGGGGHARVRDGPRKGHREGLAATTGGRNPSFSQAWLSGAKEAGVAWSPPSVAAQGAAQQH